MNKNAYQNEYMNLAEEHRLSEKAAMRFTPPVPLIELNPIAQKILYGLGVFLEILGYILEAIY